MPKLPARKAVPWILLYELATTAGEHWRRLTPQERARLQRLLKASRGRPGSLTRRERDELKALVGKLDLKTFGRDAVPLIAKRRAGRRR